MKVSPFVRRRRLAAALFDLREQHAYTTQRMSNELGIQRQRISLLENAKARPNPDEILRILEHFQVPAGRRDQLMAIAHDAAHQGWWTRFDDEMGPRQALIADLEAGAAAIVEYQNTLVPGLLQVREFTAIRTHADRSAYPRRYSAARAMQARAQRQGILDGPDATSYEVILDEAVVRRRLAPRDVMRAQWEAVIDTALHRSRVTIRLLPFTAHIDDNVVPRAAFSCYTYRDPDDPTVVTVDTNIDDLVLTDPTQTAVYTDLYQRLRRAALSPADTLDFLTTVAEDQPD